MPIPLDFFGFTLKDLAIYNKDRSFYITLSKEGNENVYEELSERIKSEGVDGLKGYFHAILEKRKGKKFLKLTHKEWVQWTHGEMLLMFLFIVDLVTLVTPVIFM